MAINIIFLVCFRYLTLRTSIKIGDGDGIYVRYKHSLEILKNDVNNTLRDVNNINNDISYLNTT